MNPVFSFTSCNPQRNPLYLGGAALLGVGFILGGLFGHQVALIAVGGIIDGATLIVVAIQLKKVWLRYQENKSTEEKWKQFGAYRGPNGQFVIPQNQILCSFSFPPCVKSE